MRSLPVESIIAGHNARVAVPEEQEDRELANSIRAVGILQPIVVRDVGHGRYRIVAGHRRYDAAASIGLHEVPAVIEGSDEADAILQITENTHRAKMDPLDVCRAIVALLDADPDLSQEALARRLGRSPSYISDALNKARRDPIIQRDIVRGRVKGRAASLMLNKSDSERRQLLSIAEEGGTLRPVVTRPSTRSMLVQGQDGWSVELSWDGSGTDARLDVKSGVDYETGLRLTLEQARRLARGLRLLCDAMERSA